MSKKTPKIVAQVQALNERLREFIDSIPEPTRQAGAIDDGPMDNLKPIRRPRRGGSVAGKTVNVPGGGNVNPNEPNDFILSGPTRPPIAPPSGGSNSGGGGGGAW